jgi:hypothetical protein
MKNGRKKVRRKRGTGNEWAENDGRENKEKYS